MNVFLCPGQILFSQLRCKLPISYDRRAGLTPKFKDVEVLCSSLTYQQGREAGSSSFGGSSLCFAGHLYQPLHPFLFSMSPTTGLPEVLRGHKVEVPGMLVYRPPFDEFEIHSIEVSTGARCDLPASSGPRIMLIQRGGGTLQVEQASVSALELLPEVQAKRGRG